MINTAKLRGKIAENGMSQSEVARALHMGEQTFYRRMKRGKFYSDEIEVMIDLLHIAEPNEIFFTSVGA